SPARLRREIARAGESPRVVLEAAYGWYWAADTLAAAGGGGGAPGAPAGGEGVHLPGGQKKGAGGGGVRGPPRWGPAPRGGGGPRRGWGGGERRGGTGRRIPSPRGGGGEVHLAHPLGVKAFTYRRVKNDERDAADLADLLRMGRLPEAWIAPAEVRELRELTRYRRKLVHLRSSGKDQVYGLRGKLGVP